MRTSFIPLAVFVPLLTVSALTAAAQVRVIKSGEVSRLDLAGLKAGGGGAAGLFKQTLETDLRRSGWFDLDTPGRPEYMVQGEVTGGGGFTAACEAYNVGTREQLLSKTYRGDESEVRRQAHRAADDLVQALTGRPGMAGTRLVMIGDRTGKKELYVCDADGQNLRQRTFDNSICVGPKWGPDAATIVYTSFRSSYPDIYLIDLGANTRRTVANYPGLNSSGSLAPSGREMAMVLSKDGAPDLFVKDLGSGQLTRLTSNKAAEASPSWSPDGRRLVYVSDVSGSPQLYVIDRGGGQPRRLTTMGSQNVDPDWGPKYIAYACLIGRIFQIYAIDPDAASNFMPVTNPDASYEDPAWAPDGRHIACTRVQNYRSRIFIVDTQTRSGISLLPDSDKGNWSSADWSPK